MTFCTLETHAGVITGTIKDDVRIFRGIPYAQAPVGHLRFMPPQPLNTATERNNKFDYQGAAMQPVRKNAKGMTMVNPAHISEDCLYLNVFAPKQTADNNTPLPVLFWIHGGSAMYGSANEAIYDGCSLAQKGMIVVTVNYRLGIFGYLELGEHLGSEYAGSGNNATRDQLMALQWVINNIAAFGGDAGKITLAGESSGAKAVTNLLAIEQARAAIYGAIIASGGECVHTLPQAQKVADIALQSIRKQVGGADIRHLDATTLLRAQASCVTQYEYQFPFRAVIDGKLFHDTPLNQLRLADCSSLNVMVGFNQHDGWFQVSRTSSPSTFTSGKLTHSTAAQSQIICAAMQSRYPEKTVLDIVSEREYILPSLSLIKVLTEQGATGWLYRFALKQITGEYSGYCVHASDLPYIWHNFSDPYMQEFSPAGASTLSAGKALRMTWVNFITHGTAQYGQQVLALFKPNEPHAWQFAQDQQEDIKQIISPLLLLAEESLADNRIY